MNIFVTADLHFGHKGVCEFLKEDGTKLRPWTDVDEMNADLAANWNSVVKPDDLVYVLGDFTVNRKYIWIAGELNGKKILIKGNHDCGTLDEYSTYFADVMACKVMHNVILTHIPVHESQLERFKHNIHGHLHAHTLQDERYTNVSVEQTNFHPILLSKVLENIK